MQYQFGCRLDDSHVMFGEGVAKGAAIHKVGVKRLTCRKEINILHVFRVAQVTFNLRKSNVVSKPPQFSQIQEIAEVCPLTGQTPQITV